MALPFCNDIYPGYCDHEKPMIDSACHEEGKEAGRHIMFQPDPTKKTTCWCICSCLGAGTPILLGDGSQAPVEALQPHQSQVLAAGKGLQFKPLVVSQVSAAAPGMTENTIYLRYHLEGQPHELVITMDHPVYVETKDGVRRIVAAASLQMTDRLLDRNGALVAIDEIHWGSYDAAFWELATSMEPPNADLDGHLLITAGVVTGDFAVATFVDYPFGLGSLDVVGDPERPHIGTPAWKRANPAEQADEVIEVRGAEFKPAALHRVEVPAHASAFLPASQAAQLEEDDAVPKRPISDEYFLEECQWLIQKAFEPLFPDITFLFDWYSDAVNSWSWVDQEDESAKYVLLSGGLSRIVGFDYEGVALALAHEVGHLKGKPVVRGGVTCEGEADFYGALNVMRMLWFGEYYFEYTTRAVEQLRTLYRYLDGPVPPEPEPPLTDSFGAAYPSNDCRIETIERAMASPKIPACAECVPPPAPQEAS
jgi:hypothetical protein